MRVQQGLLVALGHGIWVRSDEVVAIEPIHERRGPGRRSQVWVRGLPEPLVASRSEDAIIRDLTQSRGMAERARRLESAVERVADSIERIPPVLLRVLAQETGEDLGGVAAQAREAVLGDGTAGGAGRRPAGRRPAGRQPALLEQ